MQFLQEYISLLTCKEQKMADIISRFIKTLDVEFVKKLQPFVQSVTYYPWLHEDFRMGNYII